MNNEKTIEEFDKKMEGNVKGADSFKWLSKDAILAAVDGFDNNEHDAGRNLMGADENWYNPYFALHETFDRELLGMLSESELNHLVNLAANVGEGLY